MSIETPEISKNVPTRITLQNIGTYNSITKSNPDRETPDFSFFNKTYELCTLRGRFDVDGTFLHNKNYLNYKYYTGTTYYFISCSKNVYYPCYMVMELTFDPETITGTITTSLPTVYTAVTIPQNNLQQTRYIRDYLNGGDVNFGSHWVEIEAYENGVNVALNKTVTCPFTVSGGDLSIITDGITSSDPYVACDIGTLSYVQVDLGDYYNLEYTKIWHYYSDSRTYNESRTQISIDGITWTDIFNSATEGTYTETSSGKTTQIQNSYSNLYYPGNRAPLVDYYLNYDYTGVNTDISRYPATALPQTRYIKDFLNESNVSIGNHWVEIEAYQNGINVALNKTITSPNTITNIQYITNGNTDSTQYTGGDAGSVNVTVDLGDLYVIDVVKVYHYYLDGRTFFGTRTQISPDNSNWTDIFNSATAGTYAETQYGKSSGVSKNTNYFGYKLQYGLGLLLGAVSEGYYTITNNQYTTNYGFLKIPQTTQNTSSNVDYMELSGNSTTFVVYDAESYNGVYFENIQSKPSKTGHLLTYDDITQELVAAKGGDISADNITMNGFFNTFSDGASTVGIIGNGTTITLSKNFRRSGIYTFNGYYSVSQDNYCYKINVNATGSAYSSSDENLTLNENVQWTISCNNNNSSINNYIYYGFVAHNPIITGKFLTDYLGEYGVVLKNYKIPGTDITVNGVTRQGGYIGLERPDESGSNWLDSTVEFEYPRTRMTLGIKTEGHPYAQTFTYLYKYVGDTNWGTSNYTTDATTGFRGWNSVDGGIIGQGIRCSGNGIQNTGLKWYLKTT